MSHRSPVKSSLLVSITAVRSPKTFSNVCHQMSPNHPLYVLVSPTFQIRQETHRYIRCWKAPTTCAYFQVIFFFLKKKKDDLDFLANRYSACVSFMRIPDWRCGARGRGAPLKMPRNIHHAIRLGDQASPVIVSTEDMQCDAEDRQDVLDLAIGIWWHNRINYRLCVNLTHITSFLLRC